MMQIGRVQEYSLQTSLQQKSEAKLQEAEKNLNRLKEYQSEYTQTQEKTNHVSSITNRLNAGGKLSWAELSYLRKTSPELYAKALKAMKAKNTLRKKLRLCKTKGQVLALRTDVTQTAILPNASPKGSSSVPNNMTTQTGIDAYSYHATNHEWNQFKNSKAFLKLPYHTKNSFIKINKKI